MIFSSSTLLYAPAILALSIYMLVVRVKRYQRRDAIASHFKDRPLSSMTTKEAYNIMMQLQELEFPYAFRKSRKVALLKAGGIPTMTRVFVVTGQILTKNAPKRSVDTEILLREVHSQDRTSERYMQSVARMNFLHSRWRKAGKILDEDMLHTLGSGIVETFKIVAEQEWRDLTDVEKCALGVFHKNLGEDMQIPYHFLPSHETGWRDGLHFAEELVDWTISYESKAAMPNENSTRYVQIYIDFLHPGAKNFLRKSLALEIDEPMRSALTLELPGPLLRGFVYATRAIRKIVMRHLSLPRTSNQGTKMVQDLNTETGRYNFWTIYASQPWYVSKPSVDESFQPEGYELKTIGPLPQIGKGVEEMEMTMEFLRRNTLSQCPFSARNIAKAN
ncbi:Mycophenolic acid biosynthesis cluster protein B [Pseudocercospora fuligena]|uniref:Mycophenolic acid biosynthesis cluster protein B n=1 Tax=Pseudocercospora fuligena TaxID=685502 RepID=A0A8H6RNM2_9PEZI|nr:Mycophenolic acid biosynthesis cluster protein B [Pseudocercospora fuligena]